MDTNGRVMLRVAWLGLRRARDRLDCARLAILVRLCINQSRSEDDVSSGGEVIGLSCENGRVPYKRSRKPMALTRRL